MVRKNPSRIFRGAAAAVLFLTLSTLAFTTTRARHLASAQANRAVQQPTKPAAPPPDAAAQAREASAKEFVERSLRTWQDRMALNDWNIDVKLVRANELEPRTLGNIHWDSNVMKATVDVLSSYDYPLPTDEMLKDMEFTVVHELVHLELASLPKSKASRRIEEHAVNQLANALLNLAKK